MNNVSKWIHGTEVHFNKWKLPLDKQPHKGGMESHTAIFFTTSSTYALGAANGTGGLCSASLIENSNVLDMNNCTSSQSEKYREQCSKKRLGSKNPQILYPEHWRNGWKTGNIMKYAASSEAEFAAMQEKVKLAIHHKETPQGAAAHNELQILTRSVIEELVASARELGYDAVIGNEIDTLHATGPKTYPIMFVLNHNKLSEPSWIAVPK
jgi:hypothetical protein